MDASCCRQQAARLSLCTVTLLLFISSVRGYVQFEPVLVPHTAETKSAVLGSSKVTYGRFQIEEFHKIARTTEDHNCILPGCQRMGEVLDIQRNNVSNFDRETFGSAPKGSTKVDFSHYPSGGVLLQEEDLGRWFMLFQFEKPNPGTVYRMRMRLENDTDLASRLNVPLNFAPFGGLWKPRVAIPTPTNTMMGTEGNPPDAKLYEVATCMQDKKKGNCLANWDKAGFIDIVEFMRYFKQTPRTLQKEGRLAVPPEQGIPGFKPYRYGFPYEVSLTLNEDDRVVDKISKLYALGRTGAHGIAVMQDGFTVYIAGGRGGLFRFVADSSQNSYRRGELSAAILRLEDTPGITRVKKGTSFAIDWISLGTTDADSVADHVGPNSALKFRNMFDHSQPEGGVCTKGFTLVKYGDVEECLKMLDPDLAAVFEPERAASVLDATVGVFQFSQIATKLDSDRFYIGASEVLGGSVPLNRSGPPTNINLGANKCGCVFEMVYDDFYNAHTMRAITCGDSDAGTDENNECSTEGVANPRALTYVNAFENLLIGEDSEYHQNNFVWSWDPDTEKITRIFHSAQKGAITSLTWSQDVVGGNNYIAITISKPIDVFGWLSYFGSFDLTATQDMSFSGIPVPYAKGPKNLPISFRRATVGESEVFNSYKELFRTGQTIKRTGSKKEEILLGQVVSEKYTPVNSYKDGPVRPLVQQRNEVHHRFGFTSLIDMCGKIFSIAVVDSIPAVSYTVSLKESGKGQLQAVSADYNDWSRWGGLWQSGGGAVSPWNSHIGGEINEPDSLEFVGFSCLTGFSSCFKSRAESSFEKSLQFLRYFDMYFDDLNNKFDKLSAVFNPYNYGYAYEINVNKFGCSSTKKLMTLGRFSHGDVVFMPDEKTVYMVDHTTGREIGGGLFRFVAKRKGDLSSGTLYAAKLKPVIGTLEKFTMKWIELGTSSNSELLVRANSIKFTDMFDYIPSARNCRLREVNVKSKVECIDVKDNAEKWAAFFETRRYAALKGATIEFANVKGLTFDRNTGKLFMSITRISRRDRIMLQDDVTGSSNDVKVPSADCGVLYEMPVKESDDTEFDTAEFRTAYRGNGEFGVFGENSCSIEDPANPGALSSIPGHNQFLLAEDSCKLDAAGNTVSCGHENNALWSMDPFLPRGRRGDKRQKTRILTVPPLASVDSMEWYPKVGGKAFISVGLNKMYREGFDNPVDPSNPESTFGYMGPLQSEKADQRRPELRAVKPVCNDEKPGKGSKFQCPEGVVSF